MAIQIYRSDQSYGMVDQIEKKHICQIKLNDLVVIDGCLCNVISTEKSRHSREDGYRHHLVAKNLISDKLESITTYPDRCKDHSFCKCLVDVPIVYEHEYELIDIDNDLVLLDLNLNVFRIELPTDKLGEDIKNAFHNRDNHNIFITIQK